MRAKKAALYIRVSTDAQRDEGYSVEAQKEMLAAYCKSRGMGSYAYYIDGGFSGSNIERPKIQELVRDIKDGRVGTVIVYKLDRLSRSQKDTLYLIEDVFFTLRCGLYFCTGKLRHLHVLWESDDGEYYLYSRSSKGKQYGNAHAWECGSG